MMTGDFNARRASKRGVYPPFAGPDPRSREVENMPTIRDFTDQLPRIEEFLITDQDSVSDEDLPWIDELAPSDAGEEGWAISDWQSYDWSSLSALGSEREERAAAEEAWSATDWTRKGGEGSFADASQPLASEPNAEEPDAHEMARALGDIARRLRSGELAIDELHGSTPDGAMATALAVFLRMRR